MNTTEHRHNGRRRDDRPRSGGRSRARRLGLALLATATAATALLNPGSGAPASAHPTPPTVFDPVETAWASVRDLSSDRFSERFDRYADAGFLVTDLEVDRIDGQGRVGAIFTDNPDDRGWVSLRGLTSSRFGSEWRRLRDEGFRLHDQETYVRDGRRYWAGVWVENVEGLAWASRRGMTSAEFSQFFQERKDTMIPVDYERYGDDDDPRYAVVWVENADGIAWRLWRDQSSGQFSTTFSELRADFRPIDVERNGSEYAGIWHENTDGRDWRIRRDLTAGQWSNVWNRYLDLGFRLVDYEKYDTPQGVRYAGIWRQNDDRQDWEHRRAVDQLVSDHLVEHDVPGMAVAVIQDGEVRYQRGFGHADIDAGVWMDARHVNRLASVSKTVGGVLAIQLAADGLIDLDDPASDYLDLPAHHTYTVGDLASNRSCIGHYVDGTDLWGESFGTATAALAEIVDNPLEPGCGPGDYVYSTDAWTVLAAVFESATGQTIEEIVEERLSAIAPTMQLEELDENHRRVQLYSRSDGVNTEVGRDDLSWKPLGGGMQASVADLARYGRSLMNGQLLSGAQFDQMATAPNGSSRYAYGWSTNHTPGQVRIAHSGGQRGAKTYLRLMPDEDTVIAVLSNRGNGGHSARSLALDIGELVVGF